MMHRRIPESTAALLQSYMDRGFPPVITGISALDLLCDRPLGSAVDIASTASIIELAGIVEDLRFIGSEEIDAVFFLDGRLYIYREIEEDALPRKPLHPLNMVYDVAGELFRDPHDSYYAVRERSLTEDMVTGMAPGDWSLVCDYALLQARYGFPPGVETGEEPSGIAASPEEQLMLLLRILESPDPAAGLRHLLGSGYIEQHWPLIHAMVGVVQDKDFHPEGDVWDHTLEMFSYLKGDDLDLRLAVLLHDCGKAFSREQNNNRFDRHAQIGARRAGRFLEQLGYPAQGRERVDYLIRSHMIPAHASKLPLYRIEKVLSSPHYPQLLELFCCDISSSFRDMGIYYDACDHYRSYKRHVKNPYREADGSRKRSRAYSIT